MNNPTEQDFFKKLQNKLDNVSYGDMYGGSVIITALIIFAFLYLFIYFYINYKLSDLRKKWEDIKCNPLYMPFAGKIFQPTDQTEQEFTEENFDFCSQNILKGIVGDAFNPVTVATGVISETFLEFTKSVNSARDMFDYLRTQLTEIFARIYAQILVLLIPFQVIFKSLKDTMNKGNGVMLVGMQSLIGAYYTFGSFVSAIMNYMVFVILGLYIAAFIVSFFPFIGTALAYPITLAANILTGYYIVTSIMQDAGFGPDSDGVPPASDTEDPNEQKVPTKKEVDDSLSPDSKDKSEGFTLLKSTNTENENNVTHGCTSINKKKREKQLRDASPILRNTQVNTFPVFHQINSDHNSQTINPYKENDFDACFVENTLLQLWGGNKKKIKFIEIGDRLTDGSYVTALFKSTGIGHEYYSLNNTIVTGNHKLLHDETWIPVHKHPNCIHLPDFETEFVYCLNTTTKRIPINGIIFSDWDELDDYDIFELKLKMMKYTMKPLVPETIHKYLDGGFHGDTLIDLEDGNSVPISEIVVNDVLRFGEKVLAIVKIDANDLESIKEIELNKKTIVGGNNLLFQEKDLAITKTFRTINIDCNEYEDRDNLGVLYHLVTDKASFYVNGIKFYDYNGCIEWILDKDNKNLLRKLLDV